MSTITTLTINPTPVLNNFTTNIPVVNQGFDVDVIADMSVGSPPFTINIIDDDTPPNTHTINITPPNTTGLVNVIPNNIPITTYSVTSIVDGKGCDASSALTTQANFTMNRRAIRDLACRIIVVSIWV